MTEPMIVCALGICCNAFIFMLPGLGNLLRQAVANKEFAVIITMIFVLLTWPTDARTAFEQGDALGAVRIARVCVFLLLFGYLVLKNPHVPKRNDIALTAFGAYVVVCFVSALYAPSFTETIWKSFELLVLLLLALRTRKLYQTGRLGFGSIIAVFLVLCTVAVVNAIIGGLLFPATAYALAEDATAIANRSMGGIFPQVNPNSLSQYAAMLVLFAFIRIVSFGQIKTGYITIGMIGVCGIILSHSRTSAIAVVAVILLIACFKGTKRTIPIVIAIGIAGLLAMQVIFAFIARGQSTELLLSMSGRTHIWGIGWAAFLERPLFGHGFYSGHKSLDIVIGMEFSSLDSTYLESLVNVGIIGTAILVAFVLVLVLHSFGVLRFAARQQSNDSLWWLVASAFILLMFVRSVTGPSFQALHFNLLFALCFAACLRRPRLREGR